MSKKLDTAPYKGVRDFYPEDMRVQKYLFDTMREICERYGYVEYGASPLEPAELYRAKSGDEIVNDQTYTFTDRGDREVTLRPEMTPTVARMVAGKRRELGFPLRWYSIPNLFRYEAPQRGRLREHYQLNVDMFGTQDVEADAEIILVAYNILRKFGAEEKDFEIKINNRKNTIAGVAIESLTDEQKHAFWKALDKKDKVTPEEYATTLTSIFGKSEGIELVPNNETNSLLTYLKERGVGNAVFSPTLARGFDYYTGTIFEIFDTNPENRRSLFGGGRYDGLTQLFDNENIPAIGFGMGDVTLRDFLITHDLLPKIDSNVKLCIASLSPEMKNETLSLAEALRSHGVTVATDTTGRKIADKIKNADKNEIPFFIAIGEEEVANKKYKIKHLITGKEETFTQEEVAELIRKS